MTLELAGAIVSRLKTATSGGVMVGSTVKQDADILIAVVEHLRRIGASGILTAANLAAGFQFQGQRIPLINQRRGIFKPSGMRYVLSVRTVFPGAGRRVWYDDQRLVHEQIERGDELVNYAFMGTNPDAAENRWLREASIDQVPILYLLGVAPGRYTLLWPTYIADWSAAGLKVRLAFSASEGTQAAWSLPDAPERRYALKLARHRLHQATFREAVLTAYENRCAFTGLPEPRLIDAAHIVADSDEGQGVPIVTNGLPLSKVHHAAFDANLIGVDPDYRIRVSEALLSMNDGPMFEHAIKAMNGQLIRLPKRKVDYPDRDRLAARFEKLLHT